MDVVLRILEAVAPFSWPAAIVAVVAAVCTYLNARRIMTGREEVRRLRIALESEPSPAVLSQALKLWPQAARYPETQQPGELKLLANKEEGRRAQRAEVSMTMTRWFVGLSFLGAALFVASLIFRPGPTQ